MSNHLTQSYRKTSATVEGSNSTACISITCHTHNSTCTCTTKQTNLSSNVYTAYLFWPNGNNVANQCESSTFEFGEFGWIWCILKLLGGAIIRSIVRCNFLFACDLVSALTFPFFGIHHSITWLMQSVHWVEAGTSQFASRPRQSNR